MKRRQVVKLTLVAGMVGLLILPALVYTQVTGRVLNPRLRQTYPSLSAAVAAAAANDTLLVSGTLSGTNATLTATDAPPSGLKIVAARGFRGTLQVSPCPASGAILNVSGRLGALLIQGLKLVVPTGCIGVFSFANGNPLTVRGLLITRQTATASIDGISLGNEIDGPFIIEQNVIPSTGGGGGIRVDGDGTTAITASVRRNNVGSSNSPTAGGIVVIDVPATSDVTVERNRVDGGNNVNSFTGIAVLDSDGVIVQRNTVRNFVGATTPQDAGGILIVESPNTQVLRNVIANNDVGVAVCDSAACPGGSNTTQTADTVAINLNNITSTVANATGLLFSPNAPATAPLDATDNWWGAASGPSDIDSGDTTTCPEATNPPSCSGPAGGGTGLPVDAGAGAGSPDCGTTAGLVTTCPFRTSPVSPAGA